MNGCPHPASAQAAASTGAYMSRLQHEPLHRPGATGGVVSACGGSTVSPSGPTAGQIARIRIARAPHSALMPASLMIGHHFSISAF